MRYRSSLMFTFEDMTTDSTSVLKDFRHPSLSSVNVTTAEPGPKLGRVISLNRSVSSAAQSQRRRSSCKVPKRQRYMSEGHDKGDNIYDSKLFICTHNKEKGSGSSLCVSMDLGLAGAPTPLLFDKVDTDGGTESKNEEKRVQTFLQDISKYLDLKLVQEPIFLMMVWSVMAMSVGVPHVLFFVPTYVRSLPVSVDPAVLLSVTSVADLLGRIAFGFLLDSNLLPKHLMYGVMILAAGLSVIVLSFASTPALLIISMLVYGLGSGAWFLMVPLLLAEYLGVERIGSSYGLIRLFQALSNLVGPVVGGVLSDHTGSFSASFIVMGLVMSCGATLVFFKPIIEKKSLEKKIQAVPSDKQDQS